MAQKPETGTVKVGNIDVTGTIEKARALLQDESGISASFRATIELLLTVVTLLCQRLGLNSTNSSKPPSTDPNRPRQVRQKSERKPGGQPGHKGVTLEMVADPSEIRHLKVNRATLPAGKYRRVGTEKRQVVDVDFVRVVTEYQAEILEDSQGQRFTAEFPRGVTQRIQYGPGLKAHSVYMSQQQLLPYKRVTEYFADQLGIPVSAGSIHRFNQEAFQKLESFEALAKEKLAASPLLHADETGSNINKDRHWLHVASNELWVCLFIHEKRGRVAMEEMGILPFFRGVLVHDHMKAYFTFDKIKNALCNAHHLRELTWAHEQDAQQWAEEMRKFLLELNDAVNSAGGALVESEQTQWRQRYRDLLAKADKECPPPDPALHKGKRGRQKRSKSRNLLERLQDFESDVLRFMEVVYVPFTNNRAENDLRMSKVQQKISGCFRSIEGARFFCRIRSYLLTCQRRKISASDALTAIFTGDANAAISLIAQRAE